MGALPRGSSLVVCQLSDILLLTGAPASRCAPSQSKQRGSGHLNRRRYDNPLKADFYAHGTPRLPAAFAGWRREGFVG